jgi:sulfur-oxidizing protein SoxY
MDGNSTVSIFSRVTVPVLIVALHFGAMHVAGTPAALAQTASASADQPSEETWNSIKGDIFKDRPILDGSGLVILDAPRRAEDSALVPIGMRVSLADDDKRTLQSLTLVIDENPAPVAGTFTLGPHSGVTSISTRVRVNSYSYVRLIAELSDGKLYGVKAFVKASGGCSAPAASNADASKSALGQMKFRTFRADAGGLPEAQFMMRHPQNSGLQMDQLTRLYIPPFFIENLKIWQGDDLVMTMDGGIAISEDPNIRFNYKSNGAANFHAEALDTGKHLFKDEWTIEKSVL